MALLGNLTGSSQFFNDTAFYNGAISTSYRNDNASNAYLYVNKGGNGDRQKFTLSWWMKLGTLDSDGDPAGTIYTSGYSGGGGSQGGATVIFSHQRISISNQTSNAYDWQLTSSRHFSDSSSWYHICVAFDTTQSTASNRIKLYVNGVQETAFDTEQYPSQNDNVKFNNQHEKIGTWDDSGNRYNDFDGYFADWNLIDGTQLAPTSFGETKNGVWIPIDTSSLTRGTKGWRLEFKQVGVGTAGSSTVGADTGGNDFHFTSSGIVASDCAMPDSPENNFCTLNPNARGTTNVALSEGNLKFVKSGSNFGNVLGTIPLFSGKWYCEAYMSSSNLTQVGVQEIINNIYQSSGDFGANTDLGMWDSRGYYYDEGTAGGSPPTYTTGDIINIAFDVDAGKIWFGKNNTYNHSGDPANGTNQSTGSTNDLSSIGVTIAGNGEGGGTAVYNCGQDGSFAGNKTAQGNTDENGIGDFYYAPPSGFLAICTANLPEVTIGPNSATQADDYFNTVLYTGSGSSPNAITGVGFQPDWVWIKKRSAAISHAIFDSSRGVTAEGATNKAIGSDRADAEGNGNGGLSVFGSDGFTLVDGSSGSYPRSLVNDSATYVAWNWKANGGTTSSNSDGSITSTVQANTTAGFSIVTYTGTGSATTVGHGLGAVPQMYIIKNRDAARNWIVYHGANTTAPQTDFLILNTTAATADNSVMFNDTAPTSSVFTVNTNDGVNTNNEKYVAYCFTEIEGYSKFGSYTGNGSTDGAFVALNFRPSFVMTKKTSGTGNWYINDTGRYSFNITGGHLYADLSNAESGSGIDILSNGFKPRNTDSSQNASGGTYIYMAFAEAPFKYANAR